MPMILASWATFDWVVVSGQAQGGSGAAGVEGGRASLAPTMVRRGAARITARDIAKAGEGGIGALIKTLVKKAEKGDTSGARACVM